MSIRIAGDAPADKLREVVERGTDRSVVFDSISAGVPISVDVTPSDRQRDLTDPDPDGRARDTGGSGSGRPLSREEHR